MQFISSTGWHGRVKQCLELSRIIPTLSSIVLLFLFPSLLRSFPSFHLSVSFLLQSCLRPKWRINCAKRFGRNSLRNKCVIFFNSLSRSLRCNSSLWPMLIFNLLCRNGVMSRTSRIFCNISKIVKYFLSFKCIQVKTKNRRNKW